MGRIRFVCDVMADPGRRSEIHCIAAAHGASNVRVIPVGGEEIKNDLALIVDMAEDAACSTWLRSTKSWRPPSESESASGLMEASRPISESGFLSEVVPP